MDKGYDSEEIHELIRDTLTSCSLIPVRNRKRKRISGYYRRQIALSFDQEKYHQRNKVETVFSVLKRKFGESLKARRYRLQVKEIKIKVILYNLSRIISAFSMLFNFEVFYRAYLPFIYIKRCEDVVPYFLRLSLFTPILFYIAKILIWKFGLGQNRIKIIILTHITRNDRII